MQNIQTSLILLVIGIVLLWLAVTDKLSRVLDAWDLIRTGQVHGQAIPVSGPGGISGVRGTPPIAFHLPSLPVLGNSAQVPA